MAGFSLLVAYGVLAPFSAFAAPVDGVGQDVSVAEDTEADVSEAASDVLYEEDELYDAEYFGSDEDYVDEDGNIVFDDEEDESFDYSSVDDGSTGRIAGDVDERLPQIASERWKSNSPMKGAGRHVGATLARIAAGDSAMLGRNEEANVDYISNVSEIIQWGVLDGGCEIVSMTSVLNSMGYEIEPQRLADEFVQYDTAGEGDFVNYYIGSPYYSGGGYPPALAYAGNAFLDDRGSDWRFRNVTGASFQSLLAQVDFGLPVLVWTTMYMEDPNWTGFDQGAYEWYNNEHCVVLYGHKDSEGTVQVMDPMEGLVDRDAAEFERIYVECGSMALALSFG